MSQIELLVVVAIIALGVIGLIYFFQKKPTVKEVENQSEDEVKAIPASQAIQINQVSFKERLSLGLGKSRDGLWGKMSALFTGEKISREHLEQLEELLYSSDLGPKAVNEILKHLENNLSKEMTEHDFKKMIYQFLKEKLAPVQLKNDPELFKFNPQAEKKCKVIMIVGVNGAGKTTTIGKLATKLKQGGAKVVVGACDTFRAAAVDQLQVWCDRAQVTMVRAKEGANPSGVGYDTLQTAINEGADYCLLDTAGRLHTKENLMDELTKSKNVLKKLMPDAPHHTLLVLDAITGQNAINQAHEFHKSLGLTGLIFTKCDGSSKAGSAVSIVDALQVPITYIGVGESVEDLDQFEVDDYLHALIGLGDHEAFSLT